VHWLAAGTCYGQGRAAYFWYLLLNLQVSVRLNASYTVSVIVRTGGSTICLVESGVGGVGVQASMNLV
jgi:hypothetical protein